MTDFSKVFDLSNLRRAYRWTMSNPDAAYKSYFRDSYDAFAIASETHLKWIRDEGLKDRYEVSHASKILTPKPSGVFRPITLLKVEDQIVYQAIVNLIAEKLKHKTNNRYEKRVFAHLFAGKSSRFFNIQWQRSYRKFGNHLRNQHARGFDYIANFDLTSFYDTIDHHVLDHFLKELKIDEETIEYLMICLRKWTSSTWSNGPKNIYHEHGIPQGPLPSGMLSEVVLQHLDKAGEQDRPKSVYMRYVDDIKILAKTEKELRAKLIKLDIASKEVGLFPQTSKINIRKLNDPEDEIKSVSRPSEPSVVPFVNQKLLTTRILKLCRYGKVSAVNSTKFKYLLAKVTPNYRLNSQLIKVLQHHPEYAPQIASYISKYKTVPARMAKEIRDFLNTQELYHSVLANILDASLGRIPPPYDNDIGQASESRLLRPKQKALPLQPSYKSSLISWALRTGKLNYAKYEGVVTKESDWWVKKRSVISLVVDDFGKHTYENFLNLRMQEEDSEIARICAARLVEGSYKLAKPYGGVEITAKQTLKATKVIRVVGQPGSRIPEIIHYIFRRPKSTYDWKAFFGSDHKNAEKMMILIKRDKEANIEKFLVHLDSWCDLMLSEIYKRLKPGKKYPHYGVVLQDPKLYITLPAALPALSALHTVRLKSSMVHPRNLKTNKPTRRLKHSDFDKLRKQLVQAFDEIEGVIVP